MASDVRYLQQLDFPAYAVNLDWLLTDQNLIADGYDLQSAVIVALGTDALAPDTAELPDLDSTDRRGWWGDMDAEDLWGGWPVGCLLWLLRRASILEGTVSRADGWTRDAMKPFTTNRIASRIDVLSARTGIDRIDIGVVVYRGPDRAVALRYSELWDELEA
jgi:phage gp46-like protein